MYGHDMRMLEGRHEHDSEPLRRNSRDGASNALDQEYLQADQAEISNKDSKGKVSRNPQRQSHEDNERDRSELADQDTTIAALKCHLLDLPFDIRSEIYAYTLPKTISVGSKCIAWRRDNITLLAANKQIYEEATRQFYGRNVFLIDIVWDCSTFCYQWLLETGLIPTRRMAFPDQMAARNIKLMRKFHVRIHNIDSYTGMIKYNYSGLGLTDGVKDQVQFFCQALRSLPEIGFLHVHLQDDTHNAQAGQKVLEPFLDLKHVRVVTCSGSMSQETSTKLRKTLSDKVEQNYLLALPPEIRDMIYTKVLPLNITNWDQNNSSDHSSWKKLANDLSLCFTNKHIHNETIPLLYHALPFHLTCLPTGEYRFRPSWQPQPNKPRSHPSSAFPQGLSPAGFPFIRELSIHLGPYAIPDTSFRARLERFFSRLEGMICGAKDLKHVWIRYGVGRNGDGMLTPRMELMLAARLARAAKEAGKTASVSVVMSENLAGGGGGGGRGGLFLEIPIR